MWRREASSNVASVERARFRPSTVDKFESKTMNLHTPLLVWIPNATASLRIYSKWPEQTSFTRVVGDLLSHPFIKRRASMVLAGSGDRLLCDQRDEAAINGIVLQSTALPHVRQIRKLRTIAQVARVHAKRYVACVIGVLRPVAVRNPEGSSMRTRTALHLPDVELAVTAGGINAEGPADAFIGRAIRNHFFQPLILGFGKLGLDIVAPRKQGCSGPPLCLRRRWPLHCTPPHRPLTTPTYDS